MLLPTRPCLSPGKVSAVTLPRLHVTVACDKCDHIYTAQVGMCYLLPLTPDLTHKMSSTPLYDGRPISSGPGGPQATSSKTLKGSSALFPRGSHDTSHLENQESSPCVKLVGTASYFKAVDASLKLLVGHIQTCRYDLADKTF